MDKQELLNLIERISLTGPGGTDKIKKILKELAIHGGHGGGDGGGGDSDGDGGESSGFTLNEYLYYGGMSEAISSDSSASDIISIMQTLSKSKTSITKNAPCYSKYYYISVPSIYTLSKVVTENAENITSLFEEKKRYMQSGVLYILYEFHLSSDIPLNVNLTITVTE